MTETATRRVRVVIEGDAHPVSCTSDILRVQYGPHHSVMVHQGQAAVTVEDVTLERTWTDGDVLQNISTNKVQVRGQDTGWSAVGDAMATRSVTRGTHRVLRYQAGEQ